MTDKKKLDEAVTLSMNGNADDQGVTMASTIVADDLLELATILKRAGITSAQYDGPASISDDGADGVSTTINAPNLRAIMNMMEPVFQTVGDMEADIDDMSQEPEMDGEMEPVPSPEPEMSDPGMGPDDMSPPKDQAVDAEIDADGNLTLADPVEETLVTEAMDDAAFDMACDLKFIEDGYTHVVVEDYGSGKEVILIARSIADPSTVNESELFAEFENIAVEEGKKRGLQVATGETDGFGNHLEAGWMDEVDGPVEDPESPAIFYVGWKALNDEADGYEMDEAADYDYRTHDVHPTEYPGKADFTRPQPKTKYTPARSGDNPLDEASDLDHKFTSTIEFRGQELEVSVEFDYDNGDFDTGLEHPSVANGGDTLTLTSVTTEDGTDIIDFLDGEEKSRLEQSARDHMDDRAALSYPDESIASGPKSFADYVKEAELNELSRSGIRGYVDAVNGRGYDDDDDADPDEIKRRGRGLAHAQSKMVWKDARVNATEEVTIESLLDEYGRQNDYAAKCKQYGPSYFLNTDCGFASLEMIKNGTAEYFDRNDGFTVLEMDRNGKKGFNYITSYDNTPIGTRVTCVTQTATGNKFRPGTVLAAFTADELEHQYEQVVADLARLGITPSKKLSVKTFD